MRDLKYIIVLINSITEPRAIVFNGLINHIDIWKGIHEANPNWELHSAGFCALKNGSITTYPGSESLTNHFGEEVPSFQTDRIFIERTLHRAHFA